MSNMQKIEEMVNSSKNMGETIKVIAKQFNMSEDDAARIATRIIVLDAFNGWVDDLSNRAYVSRDDTIRVLGLILGQK
nr:MAG TPA: DDRGK domain protein [Caudoviricetes sp.]